MPRRKSCSKAMVMHGTCKKTSGGLTKKDIKVVRKNGQKHYVSRRKSAQAKRNLAPWRRAVAQAKKDLGIGKHEFALIKGKLLRRAREIYYE